jgi:hypothetical protein
MSTVRVIVEDETTKKAIASYSGIPAKLAQQVLNFLGLTVGLFATVASVKGQIETMVALTAPARRTRRRA